jgi:hypothetical protein
MPRASLLRQTDGAGSGAGLPPGPLRSKTSAGRCDRSAGCSWTAQGVKHLGEGAVTSLADPGDGMSSESSGSRSTGPHGMPGHRSIFARASTRSTHSRRARARSAPSSSSRWAMSGAGRSSTSSATSPGHAQLGAARGEGDRRGSPRWPSPRRGRWPPTWPSPPASSRNVYDAPVLLGGERFDIVFTSYGVLGWLPPRALGPGGGRVSRPGRPGFTSSSSTVAGSGTRRSSDRCTRTTRRASPS